MKAYMTIYWFATGQKFGTFLLEERFIQAHRRMCKLFEELEL